MEPSLPRIDPRIGIVAGVPACSRRQACSCPSHSGMLSARLGPSVCGLCLLGREGSKGIFFGGGGRKLTCPSMPTISERAASQHGVCCMAGSLLGPSSDTSAEVLQSLMPALTMDAWASSPASAMSCSPVQPPRQSGSGLPASGRPSASRSHHHSMQTSSSQTTGEAHGSLHHSWAASGSASGCWSSHSCGQHTALLGRGRIARSPPRTSQPGCWQQPGTGCAATGSWWDQTSGCGQEYSATGSEGGSRP